MDICNQYLRKGNVLFKGIKNATEAELLALKELVDADIAAIANQIDEAKTKLITDHVYADAEWLHKAKKAKRFKGQLSQHIQNQLSQRRQIRREQYEKDPLPNLLEAIKIVLTPEQREKVLDMWKQLCP